MSTGPESFGGNSLCEAGLSGLQQSSRRREKGGEGDESKRMEGVAWTEMGGKLL